MQKKNQPYDSAIVALNSIGLSLDKIGELLGIHSTTATNRLKAMGITPTYRRHAFMDPILEELSTETKDWMISECMQRENGVRDFVCELIKKAYEEAQESTNE